MICSNKQKWVGTFDEDSIEGKLLRVAQLLEEEKTLKTKVKKEAGVLHLLTQKTIEELSDVQVVELLEAKWIKPLVAAFYQMPDNIVSSLTANMRALADKYATTYAEVAEEIADTKASLASLIDGLTGNEYDMKGLREFQSLLRGE